MAKRPDPLPELLAPGIVKMGCGWNQATGWPQASGTSAWPYSTNVVWQDTTSNATYCSASQALSAGG